MNCPNCGSQVTSDQQFCRSCGESLSENERRPIPPIFWGLLMAFGGIMLALGGRILELQWLLFAGIFVAISGMFFIPAYSILRRPGMRKSKVTPRTEPLSFPTVETTNKLPPMAANDHFSSVTEGTTDLLKVPAQHSKPGELIK